MKTYYLAKGKLYRAVTIINDAGRALYAGDAASAARFNLSILCRTPGRRSPQQTPASGEGHVPLTVK